MINASILQYGAIGIGLAVLAYTAAILKQELARSKPRPEGRNLILMFMAFSLISFALAAYLEIAKQDRSRDDQQKFSAIGVIASSLDANIGGKYQAAARNAPSPLREDLQYFENNLCRDVKKLKKLLNGNEQTQCVISQP